MNFQKTSKSIGAEYLTVFSTSVSHLFFDLNGFFTDSQAAGERLMKQTE